MRRALLGTVLAAAIALATGCGTTGDESDLSRPVACVSTPRDPNDLGLRATRMRIVADTVKVTWTTDRQLHESASYSVALTDDDGLKRRELYVYYVGGEFAEVFGGEYLVGMNDLDESDEPLVDTEPPIIEGSTLTVSYPREVIEREGRPPFAGWYASIDVGPDPTEDFCPDLKSNESSPEPRPLPVIQE